MRSIDPIRVRPVPTRFVGKVGSHTETFSLSETSVIIVVKPNCGSCTVALHETPPALALTSFLFISRQDAPEWHSTLSPVIVAPGYLDALEVKFPPVYLVIREGQVVSEGPFLGFAHVLEDSVLR